MSPSAVTSVWSASADETFDEDVMICCLMPNGILINMKVDKEATLEQIKEELWEEARNYPLYGTLKDIETYMFVYVNTQAEQEPLTDETKRLCDVNPFLGILKVVVREYSNKNEKLLDNQIGFLIGKGLHEFDALKQPEVNEFRWKMRRMCDELSDAVKLNSTWKDKLIRQYPLRLASTARLPESLVSKLTDGNFVVSVRCENSETSFMFSVTQATKPLELLSLVLAKRSLTSGQQKLSAKQYVLRAFGRQEFLLGDYPLVQFKLIRTLISKGVIPQLITVQVTTVLDECPEDVRLSVSDLSLDGRCRNSSFGSSTTPTSRSSKRRSQTVCAVDIQKQFTFTVNSIHRLNAGTAEIGLEVGLFHGGETLCESQFSKEQLNASGDSQLTWDQDLAFDITVCDLPRMTRLCFVVYEVIHRNTTKANGKTQKKFKSQRQDVSLNPLAWVNTTVYDYRNQLKSGSITLYMWTYAEGIQSDAMLHPLGTVVSNPNIEHATALTVTFEKFAISPIVYPSKMILLEIAAAAKDSEVASQQVIPRASKAYMDQLKQMCERDPLHQMHEQDKQLMWFLRKECQKHIPSSLPKLLLCVKWNDHKEVAEMISLLENWPRLPPHSALVLLDYAYADSSVRSFAVECIEQFCDEELLQYLLQLVQALKHENYLHSKLAEFLLCRAVYNRIIAHFLFWHLRSEMRVPSVSVRFGLLLEAYCRSNKGHMKDLMKQTDALAKLGTLNELIKLQGENREKLRHNMHEILQKNSFADAVSNFQLPLDPGVKLSHLQIEKCKFMDSKMKPLWLVFQNLDLFAPANYLIFKNGDDLRQDMLILQMLVIMDNLWKEEGLDLGMTPYGCIATDGKSGMIEVVLQANTIANIQKEKGVFTATSTFKKGLLLAWLKDHNPDEKSLMKAIEAFTLSCAGYCVATYVLGIADRHSDNIMVKRNGQLFHIDFGHMLGNYKEKFGIRRERVPFVLTHDFVYVITRGQTNHRSSSAFARFQNYCEQAFLILRRKGALIISLFAMMLSTGIPELSSEQDLAYLRDTLVLDMSEQEALRHFQEKFDEALRNSFLTSLNWLAHNISKDNKTND